MPRLTPIRLTKAQIEEFRRYRQRGNPKIKDSSVNRDLSVLRRVLYWSVEESLLLANPLARMRMVRERRTRRQVLSVEDEDKILAVAQPHLRRIIIAALDTGMRRGEILGQCWEHIDFSRRLLFVTRSKMRYRILHPAVVQNTNPGDSILLEFFGRTRDMPVLPFYGVGPNTAKNSLTDYRERETTTGLRVIFPLARWMGIGGNIENVWPELSRPDGKTVIDAQDRYTDATAPGIFAQPSFLHTSFFLHPYHRYPEEIDTYVAYENYHDNKGSGYSFQRFRADIRYNYYPVAKGGQPRRDNVLSLRSLYEDSFASGQNRVPFYLMDTLGGSDINNNGALRGFSDMRFRDTRLLLFQAEYDKRLHSAFGGMAFYDAGRVASGNFRHSFGFGGTVWLEGRVVFRAFAGLGSGEGVHPLFGIANFF